MNIIKCPKCESTDLDVYDTDGAIDDGWIIEYTQCLECDHNFEVKAKIIDIEIK